MTERAIRQLEMQLEAVTEELRRERFARGADATERAALQRDLAAANADAQRWRLFRVLLPADRAELMLQPNNFALDSFVDKFSHASLASIY